MDIKKTQGMTMTELLVVIAIIAVLAGFASLSTELIRREQVSSVTRQLLADLQRLRLKSMTQDAKGFGISFDTLNSYTTFTFEDGDDNWKYSGPSEAKNAYTRSLPSAIELTSNRALLIFDRLGYPRIHNWGSGWLTITVRHRNSSFAKCITVHTNRIREGLYVNNSCNVQ